MRAFELLCTNNGAPRCAIVVGDDDGDACAHDACCSEIASCADDPACCNLVTCYAENCGGAPDVEACLEASCSEFAIDLRRRFVYLPLVCLPERCGNEAQAR